MLKIGDFSKLSRISIRMLRHYDEIGLLKPELVDEFTGYRYYVESQLLPAGRIQVLKNMGFGLSVIGEILDKYSEADTLEHFLLIKKREFEEQESEIRQRMRLLDSTIEWLRKDGTIMGYDVNLKQIPERYVASVRKVIPAYADEGMLWGILMEETKGVHLQWKSAGYSTAVYHDGEYRERDVDVEIQQSAQGTYKDCGNVKFKTVPAVEVASATFKGSYEKMPQVNQAVAQWVCDNGFEYDGVSFNIYHVSQFEAQSPEDCVTEVCFPVKKKL